VTSRRWRTGDIIVASVVTGTGDVVFWGWDQLWTTTSAVFSGFPPAHAVLYGVRRAPEWMGGLIIRKPGGALYTEVGRRGSSR
jgi:energy-coupling factor transport system substrate-specific component